MKKLLHILAGITLAVIAFVSQAHLAQASSDVLIYYANETHLNDDAKKNYDTLTAWLNTDDKGIGKKIAGLLGQGGFDRAFHPKEKSPEGLC